MPPIITIADFAAVTSLVISIGGVVAVWLNGKITARKNELDAATARLQASIDLLTKDNSELRKRLDDVEDDNDMLRAQLREANAKIDLLERGRLVMENQIATLKKQLVDAGITPAIGV